MTFGWARLPFPLAAALFAAAVGDPLLERLARGGIFGAGYGDDDHSGILPMLLCCAAFASFVVARRLVTVLRDSLPAKVERTRVTPRAAPFAALVELVPIVFALDLAAVYAMELLESHLSGSAPHAGLAWLGAPAAIALAFHLGISALATYAVAGLLRMTVAKLASLVLRAIDFVTFLLRPRGPAALAFGRLRSLARARSALVARHAGGRAPPRSCVVPA